MPPTNVVRPVKQPRHWCVSLAVLVCLLLPLAGHIASAKAAQPWWQLTTTVRPSNLPPGGEGTVSVKAVNLGDVNTSGAVALHAALPPSLKVLEKENASAELAPEVEFVAYGISQGQLNLGPGGFLSFFGLCHVTSGDVTCNTPVFLEAVAPFEDIEMRIGVKNEGAATGDEVSAEVTGGDAPPVSGTHRMTVSADPTPFAVEGFSMVPEAESGGVDVQAGSHPYQVTANLSLDQNLDPAKPPALLRNLQVKLPPGLTGNTNAVAQCSDLAFRHVLPGGTANQCPADTVVGAASLTVYEPVTLKLMTLPVPIFNLVPENGEPARFGFEFVGTAVVLDTEVRTGSDYGVTATVRNLSELTSFLSSTVTIWGVPGDKAHDASRGWNCIAKEHFAVSKCVGSDTSEPAPFLTLPTACSLPFIAGVEGRAWPTKADPAGATLTPVSYELKDPFGTPLGITGCNSLSFAPTIAVEPETKTASSPTGLAVRVKTPQEVEGNASGLAGSSIKDATVTLPQGIQLNAGGADGLAACAEGEVGFQGIEPGGTAVFTPELPEPICPEAAKVGTVKLRVPILERPLEGSVYLADQNANPFHSLIAMYVVAQDPVSGVVVKLAGEVTLSETGQISTTLSNTPQAPVEEAEFRFFGGPRAVLSTPSTCGRYEATAVFTPWSGTPPVTETAPFEITTPAAGRSCAGPLPLTASLKAGAANVQAGGFTPVTTTIEREDGEQEIRSVSVTLPKGLTAMIANVERCPEASANAGSCGAGSLVGHSTVSVGVGGNLYTIGGGQVFLTGPYRGAPFGIEVVTHAKAGPLDLGPVVVRGRLTVDPVTAQATVVTDADGPFKIPRYLKGIPVELRKINVSVDRSNFAFNPTNCSPLAFSGEATGFEGAGAGLTSAFTVANCTKLKFAPGFSASTTGKTSKANGASLHVKLAPAHEGPQSGQAEEANIAKVKVELPKALPSRLTTLQKACTAAQFDANPAGCPEASVVGTAVAHTPILSSPLTGPAYFVSHGNEAFPQLIMVLAGENNITIDLVGDTFISKAGITSSTFASVPDVPVSSFELTLPQGKHSALAANGSLCTQKLAMPTEFVAQNGAVIHQSTPIGVTGCAKKKALTRAQKLTAALKACHKKPKAKHAGCEKQAHRHYGPIKAKKKAKK
jgi:hypothetical protein